MALLMGVVIFTACKGPKAPEITVKEDPVVKLARQINYKCPFMVDPDTRMDSVNILSDGTFQYNYTLVRQVKERIDIPGLTNFMAGQLIQTASTSSTMELHREQKLRMVFHYRDRNGNFVTRIILEPEDYLQE